VCRVAQHERLQQSWRVNALVFLSDESGSSESATATAAAPLTQRQQVCLAFGGFLACIVTHGTTCTVTQSPQWAWPGQSALQRVFAVSALARLVAWQNLTPTPYVAF
jgi:hypothetical protein